MKLVICEKNIAARRIAYILSNGTLKKSKLGTIPTYEFSKDNAPWAVIGLKGHIISLDYPHGFNQWKKIPPRELINVEPDKKISERGIASALKTIAINTSELIVATDYDREGELIGTEAVELLKTYNPQIKTIKRAKFSAITRSEVNQAFNNLVEVDYNLSNAAETRQQIDLVWGAVLTRFISLTSNQLGKDFLSIGRVQSPTLALLVDREKEITSFVPEPFWQIIARLKKETVFKAVHVEGKFWDEAQAQKLFEKVKGCKKALVQEVKKTVERERPPAPFNTTSFLQAASALGFSASQAMSLAEELYMGGLISYPRTDNTVYPHSLNIKGILEKLKQSPFAQETIEVLTNGRQSPTRGKHYSTDHPPIHPVGVPSSRRLSADQQRIYELVVRRFLATLAKDAISESVAVSLNINRELFTASGYRLLEPNWRSIYTYIKEKRKPLPEMAESERIPVTSITLKEDHTKPPSRYTQGALIAKMEQLSLGTKSTRHEIIGKLYGRNYITGSPPRPTSTAVAVIDALGDYNVVKPDMTAQLEHDMSKIADGKKTLTNTVKESRGMLTQVMDSLEKDKESIRTSIKDALKQQRIIGTCPRCGSDMIIRKSKKGKRFVGCTNYPRCDHTYSLPQKGGLMKSDKTCKKCGAPMINVKLKGKKLWELCLNSSCPGKKSK
jgi:DNA topoisomerase-1